MDIPQAVHFFKQKYAEAARYVTTAREMQACSKTPILLFHILADAECRPYPS